MIETTLWVSLPTPLYPSLGNPPTLVCLPLGLPSFRSLNSSKNTVVEATSLKFEPHSRVVVSWAVPPS